MKRKITPKELLLALGKYLLHFMRRLYVFAFFYGVFAVCSYGFAIAFPLLLKTYLGADPNLCLLITKIFLTIAPAFPTIMYLRCYEEDVNDEFSMDLCFITWIATIVLAWFFL